MNLATEIIKEQRGEIVKRLSMSKSEDMRLVGYLCDFGSVMADAEENKNE